MNRTTFSRGFIGLVFIFGTYSSVGQDNLTSYHQKNNIEKLTFNPALYKDEKAHAQLGVMSLGVGSSSNFLYSDLIHKGTGDLSDSLVIDIPKFKLALDKDNYLSVSASSSIFHLMVRGGKRNFRNRIPKYPHYTSFMIRNRVTGGFFFDKNYIELFTQGNAPFYNDFFQTGQANIDISAFTETSVSHGRQLSKRLWVGVRAKFLHGLYDIKTQEFSLGLQGFEFENYVDVQAQGSISVSGPVELSLDQNGFLTEVDFQPFSSINPFSMKNPGYAFDLGLVYELSNNLFLSLSVTDLGKITWRQDVQQIALNTQYRYEPLNFDNSYDDDSTDYVNPSDLFDELSEDIKQAFVWTDRSGSYSQTLNSKFYAGLQYRVNADFDIGLTYLRSKIKNYENQILAVSANMKLLNVLSFSPTYIHSNGVNLFGGAIGLQLGSSQIYASVTDISSLIDPANSYRPGLQLGFTLRLEKERKR
jgi:hypothetical protein